jgi:hypothetical protein
MGEAAISRQVLWLSWCRNSEFFLDEKNNFFPRNEYPYRWNILWRNGLLDWI